KKPPAKPAPIPKVATRKKVQALKQESNPKPKKKRLKVATFTKAKVATFLFYEQTHKLKILEGLMC
ncbi:MAG TPA: hypothetical protein VK536_07595, partial [Candidatus Limnocylindrales bacterium]|nr:hypothetical protein [Candidatus Limnocylindrales bacterium]